MATRTPQRNLNSQADVRSSSNNRDAGADGTVFRSMKEFWFWVAIVTLIIFGFMLMSFGLAYQSKQLKEAKIILQRLEEKERKQKLLKEKEE